MNNKREELIKRLKDIFSKRSKDFTFENCEGDQVGVLDYYQGAIPTERVEADFELMKSIVREGKEVLERDDFYVLIAAFCSYYIEEGLHLVLSDEYYGLASFFSSWDDNDVVYCIFKGVTTQDYSWFESIYEIDNKCTVANVYLFVKAMDGLTYAIVTDRHVSNQMEKNVWKYYEQLDDSWKEYVIQRETENTITLDKSPLPYIRCSSFNNHMMQMIKGYLQDVLDKLEIDIDEVDPSNLYNVICDKYGTNKAIKLIMDFSGECQEKYPFNITPGQTYIPEDIKKGLIEMQGKMIDCFQNVSETLVEGYEHRSNTYYSTLFMYEKLGYMLSNSKDEREEESRFVNWPFPDCSSSILYRYTYLHIPVNSYDSIDKEYLLSRYRNFVSNRELGRKNEEIEKLNKEKLDMMDYYAHSWKHISYPKIVKDVAEALLRKEDGELITMANKLLRAYNSEQTLKHGIQLLQYSISSQKETVKKEFQKGFWMIDLPKEDGIVGVETILNESLDMVILRLMMDDIDTSKRMKKCRARIVDIDLLREEYTEKFLRKKKGEDELLKWVNNNLFNISFGISDEWNRVRIDQESFAAAQLTEIFVELLTNIMLYGNENARIELSSDLYSMDIIASNDYDQHTERKGGKGLKTLLKVIDRINFESRVTKGLEKITKDNRFTVHIRIDRGLIYKD